VSEAWHRGRKLFAPPALRSDLSLKAYCPRDSCFAYHLIDTTQEEASRQVRDGGISIAYVIRSKKSALRLPRPDLSK
jgi:hypothetical protein